MHLRLLLLLLVCVGVVLWWKQKKRGIHAPPPVPPPTTPQAEAMLRCAHCGVHLPASQALPGRGGVFCSAEHRECFEANS